MEQIVLEIVKIVPSILWYLFVVVLVALLYRPLKEDLLLRLKTFEAAGVKFSVISESINAALKFADEINVANNNKSNKWNIPISLESSKIVENRAKANIKIIKNVRILWIDDNPKFNYNEIEMFKQLGVETDSALNSIQAMHMLEKSNYDLIFSDIARGDNSREGLEFLTELKEKNITTNLIFYVGHLDSPQVPLGAFGITNRPNELLHLTLDVLERTKY